MFVDVIPVETGIYPASLIVHPFIVDSPFLRILLVWKGSGQTPKLRRCCLIEVRPYGSHNTFATRDAVDSVRFLDAPDGSAYASSFDLDNYPHREMPPTWKFANGYWRKINRK